MILTALGVGAKLICHRDNQICYIVGQCNQLGFLLQSIRDHQRLILDRIDQTTGLIQQQIQRTSQSNPVHINTDWLICCQAFRFDSTSLHGNIDAVDCGDVSNDFRQGHIMEVQGDFLTEALLDLQFAFCSFTAICTAILLATF